jgi:hypothetical protein
LLGANINSQGGIPGWHTLQLVAACIEWWQPNNLYQVQDCTDIAHNVFALTLNEVARNELAE